MVVWRRNCWKMIWIYFFFKFVNDEFLKVIGNLLKKLWYVVIGKLE